jgi:hypothetical protein
MSKVAWILIRTEPEVAMKTKINGKTVKRNGSSEERN